MIESSLPAVITTQKGLNEPRYASLPGIMKAKKKPLEEKTLADLGLDPAEFGEGGRKLKIVEMTPPPQRAAGKIIDGATPEDNKMASGKPASRKICTKRRQESGVSAAGFTITGQPVATAGPTWCTIRFNG